MKKRITLILILMTLCACGITGLQLYWNYRNYQTTVKTFDHDINEALQTAVNREMAQRQRQIVQHMKHWLADTAFSRITCTISKGRHPYTVFHIEDTHPLERNEKGLYLGFSSFKALLNQITPQAKKAFIDHFGDIVVKADLEKGIVYYYTPRLGDSLTAAFDQSRLNPDSLRQLYERELHSKGIMTAFELSPPVTKPRLYQTQAVNSSLRRPYKKELIAAGFESPGAYYIAAMKWLIVTSLLLIGITLFCFGYTVRTLLSQHKLALLKDDFINNMTHELNTPLSSIQITAEALRSFDHSPDTQKEYLEIISYQADKLIDLTAQLLDNGKLNKPASKNSSLIALNTLIEKAIKDMEPQSNSRQAGITCQLPEKAIFIKGEAGNLLNALNNLIDNALKYADGTARLHISLVRDQVCATITFTDQGIGIPVEYRALVFDPFFRVPKGNTHDVKGYGLGLNYVRLVAEQHRGSINVTANEPTGCIFTFKIPLA